MCKTFAYWKEQYGGIFTGIVCAVFVFWIKPELSNWKDFIQEIPNIGMCIFGFLLTFLGIILQGGSKTIEWMKSRETLFQRFISFNKRVVILSIVLSVYAYFLGYFNFECLSNIFKNYSCALSILIRLLISVFSFLFIWLLIDILKFTKIFYSLIK
ncbi:MAG: hypothetical protein LBS54_06925 [Dysgonamonadaceae bacterium]|jgi:hypothetical protein|nr:hypothetical protein [Dysgonamonadaceae bacterium]